MKRILPCEKDTYITNRIFDNSYRATDSNVGDAGTLDLFKLAGESSYRATEGPYVSGTTDPIELSRLLLKFDLDRLRELTGSILDINDPSFKCELQLFDVLGGQTLPSNFSLILYPLAQEFDEGRGRDVASFEDIDVANFITASVSANSPSAWFLSGADARGYNGQSSIDIITGSAELGDLFVVQEFSKGSEDLKMDITKVVSATLTDQIPDYGFRISYSGTQETNNLTYFVKRFASRHANNTRIRPKISVGFDDSIFDNREDFLFDVSGSLFLYNYQRGQPANLLSSGIAVTGSNSLLLTLASGSVSGTYSQIVTASQLAVGDNLIPGVYKADFSIASNDQFLSGEIQSAGSATFTETWTSLDGFTTFLTRDLIVKSNLGSSAPINLGELKINITNMKSSFKSSERVRFRVFAQDDGFNFVFTKLPVKSKSLIYNNMYWQLRDALSNEVIIPFDTDNNSTRLSADSEGMQFEVFISDLDVGRVYEFDLMIDYGGNSRIFESVGGKFRVEF